MNIEDKITLYALNALDADEQAAFELELQKSPQLRAKLAEERAIVASFAELAEPVTPSSKMQHQLMARIDADIVSRQPRLQTQTSVWANIINLWRSIAPVGAVFASVLALVMGIWAVNTQRELIQLRNEWAIISQPGTIAANVPPTNKQSSARATVFVTPGHNQAILSVANLSAVDTKQTYQAWLIRDGKPVPAGVFNTDATGSTHFIIKSDVPINGKELVGITIEQAGGAATPNMDKLMFVGPLT